MVHLHPTRAGFTSNALHSVFDEHEMPGVACEGDRDCSVSLVAMSQLANRCISFCLHVAQLTGAASPGIQKASTMLASPHLISSL